jgi:hypothetical protein
MIQALLLADRCAKYKICYVPGDEEHNENLNIISFQDILMMKEKIHLLCIFSQIDCW